MEKKIKDAIMDVLMEQVDRGNNGMLGRYKVQFSNISLLRKENISVSLERGWVKQDDKVLYKVQRNFASRKVNGMYAELKPKLIAVEG